MGGLESVLKKNIKFHKYFFACYIFLDAIIKRHHFFSMHNNIIYHTCWTRIFFFIFLPFFAIVFSNGFSKCSYCLFLFCNIYKMFMHSKYFWKKDFPSKRNIFIWSTPSRNPSHHEMRTTFCFYSLETKYNLRAIEAVSKAGQHFKGHDKNCNFAKEDHRWP